MTVKSSNQVTVVRDSWGIGHATADNADGAFWAQGWLAASDRLWQMEWDRRRALGRWAEVAGNAAVGEDKFFRRLDLASTALSDWAALGPQAKAMTETYTAGVNAWLAENGETLPPEFAHHPAPPAPWEPWHCVLVYKLRHIFMGTLHRKLWRAAVTVAAGPDVVRAMVGDPSTDSAMAISNIPAGGPTLDLLTDAVGIMERAATDLAAIPETDGGSNSWAVDGSRTKSGRPLLAGDPHRGIEFPNVYYQCHIACDAFDVIGLAFPGVPGFPHFGHNGRVAWCITHGMADDTDVFIERDGPAVARTETIDVLGETSVDVDIATTERGPVVLGSPGSGGPVLSMMWTGMSGVDSTIDCLPAMLAAGDVDQLEAAVDRWVIPVNNLLSADVDGNISFRIRGRVVERSPASRWTPVPGDDEHSWTGLEPVADADLHRWRNPERGFLVTANNRTSDDPPYISLDFAGPARHDRVVQLLEGRRGLGVADMTAIHSDTMSLVAPKLIDTIGDGTPTTELGVAARQLVTDWDGDVRADSSAALAYAAIRRLWSVEVAERLAIAETTFGESPWPQAGYTSRMLYEATTNLLKTDGWRHVPGLDGPAELHALVGELTDRAAADIAERFGPDTERWRWSEAHVMVSPHPLASARPDLGDLHPPVDGGAGDGDTVRAASLMPLTGDRMAASSVARYVFDVGEWDNSGWVVPHGVSGVRGSGHDLDQRAAWLACELVPMAYSSAAVAKAAAATEVLTMPRRSGS